MAFPKKKTETEIINVQAPNMKIATLEVIGNAPFYYNKWPHDAFTTMRDNMASGTTAKARAKVEGRKGRDFHGQYLQSVHFSTEGWHGIPTTAFQQAIVRAASDVKPVLEMTQLKRCISVQPEGFAEDGFPLVKVLDRELEYSERPVRLKDGSASIVAVGRLSPGWRVVLRVMYDADKYSTQTIANLVVRAGIGVGVGAGRPASKSSCGMGWGTFSVQREEERVAAE
jgi:hypothetical protein